MRSRLGIAPRRCGLGALLTGIALGLGSGSAAAALRANYEVALTVDGSVHAARNAVAVQSGVAIVHDFEPGDVRLVPRVDEGGG